MQLTGNEGHTKAQQGSGSNVRPHCTTQNQLQKRADVGLKERKGGQVNMYAKPQRLTAIVSFLY